MADPPTGLSLPPSLPYPLTITRLLVRPGQSVIRGTPLVEYTFTSDTSRNALSKGVVDPADTDGVRENDMVGTWESGIEGDLVNWAEWARVGEVVHANHSRRQVVFVQQACTHPVQLHGMCGICGADLTTDDYLTRPHDEGDESQAGPSRHPGGFEMSHDALGVTVSTNEARRLENQTRDALLFARKLSLIVDLDQTIIHTTVDPTVGEWMTEIQEDEKRGRGESEDGLGRTEDAKGGTGTGDVSIEVQDEQDDKSTTPPASHRVPGGVDSPLRSTTKKETNPNAEALKDVARFQLADDLPPGHIGKSKGRQVTGPERCYYTKPRPGLQRFLQDMNNYYEMHVYTMGTRSYADAICDVIDPDGKIFGGRVLSRDESGSLSSKNLKRLFPTDTSMVVVIDDRSDVWGDCPNLVKVVPYDFFLGIGDINSSFLPPTSNPPTTPPQLQSPSSSSTTSATLPPETPLENESRLAQAELLDKVSESRPLAKMQEQLEKEQGVDDQVERAMSGEMNNADVQGMEEGSGENERSTTPPGSPPKPRKPLLNPNDGELNRVAGILTDVHRAFYKAYDARSNTDPAASLPMACDAELIIPELKSRVLAGCTILFSGVIPRHQRPETSEIFLTAEAFGAKTVSELTPDTTHCVTAMLGTEKAYKAYKAGAKVVWVGWFWQSVVVWERQDEEGFLASPPRVQGVGESSRSASASASGVNTPRILVEGRVLDGEYDDDGGGMGNGQGGNGIDGDDADGTGDEKNEAAGQGWDEDAQAELDAFLEGSSDWDGTDADLVSEAGDNDSVRTVLSPSSSMPGTPRKRVRYADEESLPLETYQDPSPNQLLESPPKKKKKLLLLEAPKQGEEVPEENRFMWRGKMKREAEARDREQSKDGEETEGGLRGEDEGDGAEGQEGDEGEGDEDAFEKMLMESMEDA